MSASPAHGLQAQRTLRPPVPKARILLLHSRVLFRTSLASVLSADRGLELVAEYSTPEEGIAHLEEDQPDIVLLDFEQWQEFVPAAQQTGWRGKFLALAEDMDRARCARALGHGVAGIFWASDSPARLMQAIRIVLAGGAWIEQSLLQFLAGRFPMQDASRLENLTERQQAVLRGILSGLSNRAIGAQIGVSEGSVKATLQRLFNKTGVRTRSQLIRIVLAG